MHANMVISITSYSNCPSCAGQIEHDEKRGERACTKCGIIIESTEIDIGPEWRSFSFKESQQKSRVGPPTDRSLHDRGLSTTISWADKDANGNVLPAQKRRQMNRLRTWHIRSQTPDSKHQYRKQALGEIDRMGSALGLPTDVRKTAGDIFRQAHQNGIVAGRSIEAVAAAGLHIAAAIASLNRTLDEITHVARVNRTPIARAKRAINTEFNLAIEPSHPSTFLERFGSELDLNAKSIQKARTVLESAPEEYLGSGASPVTIAAAALYLGDRLTGGPAVTQKEVGDCCDIYDRVIQDHYPQLEEFYEVR